jgi:hypothetical protein
VPGSTTALADPWEVVQAVNRAWVERRPEEALPHLHESVVYMAPGIVEAGRGREAVIAGYREFIDGATIHGYDEVGERADVAGDTAVVTYRWMIDYTMGGERLVESGVDLFVLTRQGETWLVTWRLLLPDPRPTE